MAAPTPNYGLKRPDDGTVGWGSDIRGNFDILDTVIKAAEDNANLALSHTSLLTPKVASLEASLVAVQGQLEAIKEMLSLARAWSLNVVPDKDAAVDFSANYALVNAVENLTGMNLQYPSEANGIWGLTMMDTVAGVNPPALTVDVNWYLIKPIQPFKHFLRVGQRFLKIGETSSTPITGALFTALDISPSMMQDPVFAADPSYLNLVFGLDQTSTIKLDGTFIYVQITKIVSFPSPLFRVRIKLCNNDVTNVIGYKLLDSLTAAQVSSALEGYWDLSVHQDLTSHFSINGVKQISTLIPAMPSAGALAGAMVIGYEIANLDNAETLYLEYNNLFELNIGHDPSLGA